MATTSMKSTLAANLSDSLTAKQALAADDRLQRTIGEVAGCWLDAFRQGRKVLFCGNGGSAADAQHLAAELSGRFYLDRDPLPAEALHVNASFLTAIANDYDFATTYARMVQAIGQGGDVLMALSTSGNSPNIVRAARTGQALGMTVVAMTGAAGGDLRDHCDLLVNVPSRVTPRIQELHMLIGHALCEYVEAQLFGPSSGD